MNVSPYAYVASNPINYIDPFGLWKAGQNIPLVWISGEDNEMSGGGGGGAGYTYLPMIYGHSYGPFENGGGSFAFGGNPNIRVTGNGGSSGNAATGLANSNPLNLPLVWIQPTPMYTYDGYIKYWEKRHGIEMSQRRRDYLDDGCVGITSVELGYQIKTKEHGEKSLPSVANAFRSFELAKRFRDAQKKGLAYPLFKSFGCRYIIYGIKFHSPTPNGYRSDDYGRVDMSNWNPERDAKKIPGGKGATYIPFDFGNYDDETYTFWDANEGGIEKMIIYQKTYNQFHELSYDGFDRIVYVVALALPRWFETKK